MYADTFVSLYFLSDFHLDYHCVVYFDNGITFFLISGQLLLKLSAVFRPVSCLLFNCGLIIAQQEAQLSAVTVT